MMGGPGVFQLKFAVLLEDVLLSHFEPEAGCVAFHRWLPNGEQDSLSLPLQWRGELKVWFERYGYPNELGFIQYDRARRELSEDVIRRNAVAFSGPLFGRLTMEQVDRGDLDRVRTGTDLHEEDQRTGHLQADADYYKAFGKQVAKLLGPPLAKFFELIRYEYGQYWVRDFSPWDSRTQEIGYFFHGLQARWFDDVSNAWRPFRPTPARHEYRVSRIDWEQFLTEQDWRAFADAVKRESESDPAVKMLSRANGFLNQDEVATSLVESISSLEIAMERFVARRLGRSGISRFKEFDDYKNGPKLRIVLAILDPPVSRGDATQALEAIEQRNKFVHEGVWPPNSAKANVRSVLGIVARLLGPPGPKLPSRAVGTRLVFPP
ncbi:MAG TPA: hypothetical protein VIV15_10620 [Anaerolineales bacterium]